VQELPKQSVELVSLLLAAEGLVELAVDLRDGVAGLARGGVPVGRGLKRVRASVGRVAPTLDKPGRFETVETAAPAAAKRSEPAGAK